jgi:hypothetical protein
MHRLIMGVLDRPDVQIDHKDSCGLNNQRSNLRHATAQANGFNKRARVVSTSQYKGVNWDAERGLWLARIAIDGRRKNLGRFAEEQEGAAAYNIAAERLFGEFAKLNDVAQDVVEAIRRGGRQRRQKPPSIGGGVYWHPRQGCWQAHILVDGIRQHLGYFDTKEEGIDFRNGVVAELQRQIANDLSPQPLAA